MAGSLCHSHADEQDHLSRPLARKSLFLLSSCQSSDLCTSYLEKVAANIAMKLWLSSSLAIVKTPFSDKRKEGRGRLHPLSSARLSSCMAIKWMGFFVFVRSFSLLAKNRARSQRRPSVGRSVGLFKLACLICILPPFPGTRLLLLPSLIPRKTFLPRLFPRRPLASLSRARSVGRSACLYQLSPGDLHSSRFFFCPP